MTPGDGASPGAGFPDEKRSGGTPAGRAVNDALRSFSKAARSFSLYDSKNEAIRRFLGEYREKMLAALAAHGPIGLEVRPFALALAGEVVYEEDDRERSLAFRLFRDGVRKITFGKQTEWEELLRLLEILSVRFTGVRQQEDDIVTLLRKAGFRGIQLESVEGFVPEEEDPEEEGFQEGSGAVGELTSAASRGDGLDFDEEVDAPGAAADFDLPLPPPPSPVGFTYREVPARYLQSLQEEETQETLPARAVRLCEGILKLVGATEEPLPLEAALPIFGEVRDFFLADRQLGPLATLVTLLREGETEGGDVFGKLLEPLGTEEALLTLLESVPPGTKLPPPELLALLGQVPGDHDANLFAVLGTGDDHCRALARGLVALRAKEEGVDLLARIGEVPPQVGKELMTILLEAQPGRSVEIARELCATGDPGAQLQVVGLLEKAPPGDEVSKMLQQLLQSSGEEVRTGAIRLYVSRKEPRAFDTLVKLLDARAPKGMGLDEAKAFGEALAKLSEKTALGLFAGWVRVKSGGLLGMVVENKATRVLQWAAASGLGVALADEAEPLLKELGSLKAAPEELKALCVDLMSKRRKGGRPHG